MGLPRYVKRGSFEVVPGYIGPDPEQLGIADLILPPDIPRGVSAWKTQLDDNGDIQIGKKVWIEGKSSDPETYHRLYLQCASGVVYGRVL